MFVSVLPPSTERNALVFNMPLPAGMSLVGQTPDRWSVRVEHDIGELLPLLGSLPVRDLDILEPALEDVLRSFYRTDRP